MAHDDRVPGKIQHWCDLPRDRVVFPLRAGEPPGCRRPGRGAYRGPVSTNSPPSPGARAAEPSGAGAPQGPAPEQAPRPVGLVTWARQHWLWGWPAIAQLTIDLLLAGVYLTIVTLAIVGIATVPVFLVGVPILVVTLALAHGAAALERVRVYALTGVYVPSASPPPPDQPTWRRVLFDTRPYQYLAHMFAISLWGLLLGSVVLVLISCSIALVSAPLYYPLLPGGIIALPWDAQVRGYEWAALLGLIGLAGLMVVPPLARLLVLVDSTLARWLLGPSDRAEVERLSERVETLTQTRVATVDSVEAERRRIERDLHDGPQQRLVAIAMDLGMAREQLDDPEIVRELLDKAHTASKEAITEMRQVARGIHPPVLTHRGLDAALSALAARSPIPVDVHVDVPERPSPTVEAIAYFCVSEALTNVAKHARAQAARVDVRARGGMLGIHVSDNGVGGADEALGTGLRGLADRVRAVDGTLDVSSPRGGPTVLTVYLPTTRPTHPDRGDAAPNPGSTS
jgi:signal transduction histidine kinase